MGRVINTKKYGPAKPNTDTAKHDWSQNDLRRKAPWLFSGGDGKQGGS